jgi:DNA-binding CsgD family transcriptional regulator
VASEAVLQAGCVDALSARELQVLDRVSAGCTNREAADALGVTVHAIKFHLASIYRKLGVDNRTEAAVAFASRGRLPSPAREESL